MKYMGSKRWMLGNGLGHLLDSATPLCERFVDLFSGSSAVTRFVATRHDVSVYSADLQTYSKLLAGSIIERTEPLAVDPIWTRWKESATHAKGAVRSVPDCGSLSRGTIKDVREWCSRRRKWLITRAYGGHYFSPDQALWLDALRMTLPVDDRYKTVALAAVIDAAAYCAAAPGHTAQPFQPTRTAKPFLREAWERDVLARVERVFGAMCAQHARIKGLAVVEDANVSVTQVRAGDLVFIDPPYSGVQYSRFYHVLETVATGYNGPVSGVGRYPRESVRPQSDFSLVSKAKGALEDLLSAISTRGAAAIVTFPEHECSNGLSGTAVTGIAQKYFRVSRTAVSSRFSSLGGTSGESSAGSERAARVSANELILHLEPKTRRS